MKILLIVPTFQYSTRYPAFLSMGDFPSGLACLAAALKAAGHEVIGLNPNNDTTFANQQEMVRAKIQECLRLHKFGLIGLGGLCTDYHFIRDALRLVREFAPDTPVVMGNGIVSNDAEFIFKTMKPDFCISGEAEESLVSLVDHLERGDKNYEDVVNLGYWENGVAKFTKADFKYLNVDLNKRPFPDYEPFDVHDMLDNYWMASRYHYRYPRKEPRMFPIVAARSCPFQCTFCVHHRVIRYRARTLENIVEEIDDYFTSNGTAWITPKDLSLNTGNKFITRGELDVSDKGIKAASLNIMPKGTILLSSRAPIGYLAISREHVTTNQGFKSFVPRNGYSTEYVYYSIQNMIPTIENNSAGSTFKEVSGSTLKAIKVGLPDTEIIQNYTSMVENIFNRQDNLERQNQTLAELRDWLLPMLMNGQVQVKSHYVLNR